MPIASSNEQPFSVEQLQAKIDHKTKPLHSLGRVEELALQIGAFKQSYCPRIETCRLMIFAADHGIAESGVSAYPQQVTRQMVLNFLQGGAAANVFADSLGVDLQVVDAGLVGEGLSHGSLLSHKIGPGTANSVVGPAMSEAQFDRAVQIGRELGGDRQTDALCCGEMGIANTSAATLLCHKILGLPLSSLTGRGTGLDDEGLQHKLAVLQSAAARTPGTLDASTAMIEYGGFEIAMMTGAMLGAASSGSLVIVDGFIGTAAAITASAIDPESRQAMIFAHCSAEAGHRVVMEAMGIRPLLELDLRLGEGTGALLAWPLVKCAAAMLCDMASFDSADVSGPA